MSKLDDRYKEILSEYIAKFAKKHGLEFDSWVGDRVGEIACFGCVFYFNFSDIWFDIESKQPKGLIIEWLYDSIEHEDKTINFRSYSYGLRFNNLGDVNKKI